MECVLWDGQGEKKVKTNRIAGNYGRRFFAFCGREYGGAEWVNSGNGFFKASVLNNKSAPHFPAKSCFC